MWILAQKSNQSYSYIRHLDVTGGTCGGISCFIF